MKRSSKNEVGTPQPATFDHDIDGTSGTSRFPVVPIDPACHAIHLDSCLPFDRIAVRTHRSDYEVVVLPGSSGKVLVRGGRYFTTFQLAALAGSTFGGSAIRLRSIEVGGQLELRVDGRPIVTSTIEAVSRTF
jgi:hypothetical protein